MYGCLRNKACMSIKKGHSLIKTVRYGCCVVQIMELLGWKTESVVEMAMRSRTKKNRGYQKLPTSIHDTVTHED